MSELAVFDEMDVRRELKRACIDAGGTAEFARKNGLSDLYVTDALKGEVGYSSKLLDVLGFESVRRYVKA